jgi:DNA segregation ATPase FtsK/SpoIIIE-like protein
MRYMLKPSVSIFEQGEMDDLFEKTVELVVEYDKATASLIQRRLGIGYARAARILDQLETAGVVGPAEGAKPRRVLIHSPRDIFGDIKKKSPIDEDDVYKAPANYKVPADMKLSKLKDPSWGKQLSDVVNSNDFKNLKVKYPILLGLDEKGKLHTSSISEVNNLLNVGNPVSKKENWIDTILVTLLLKHSPKELRFILVDETHYLGFYNGIPHLLTPVITDFDKAISAYRWTLEEISRRMKIFIQAGARDIDTYNQMSGVDPLPRILIVTFQHGIDIETTDSLTWLTSNGFKTGIHLVLVANRLNDQTISADVKANIPARAVFKVTSPSESNLAGVKGAENLGAGEMIFKQGNEEPKKLTTVFTTEENVKEVVDAVKQATK